MSYQHPGVYIEELPSGSAPIEAASTSTALIAGFATKGPVGVPTLLFNFDQYTSQFGGINDFKGKTPAVDYMGHAVQSFFNNGGTKAYIARVAINSATATVTVAAPGGGSTPATEVVIRALNAGAWGNGIIVNVTPVAGSSAPPLYTVAVGRLDKQGNLAALETYADVTFDDEDAPSFISTQLKGVSHLIEGDVTVTPSSSTATSFTLAGGADGLVGGQTDYDALFPQLKKLRDISIILLPGLTWPADQNIIADFIGHAGTMKNRMVIVDPTLGKEFVTSLDFTTDGFPSSTYAVTYYPWLQVTNPWYQAELRPDRERTVFVPPSGFAAGLWARTDGRRGVWKAPAGLQASLLGAASTQYKVGDDEQDQLNPVGLNCFRRIISDIVIWGSRTLATKTDPEWRYVPVRRTAMMIEESVYQGIQWAVFEPNDHRLWSSLRLNIGAFMNSLFRAGAFQGEKASDAYFVRCGLGDTMTQGDIDAGQVIVLVGFAPVKPAEFVIVRIQQIVGKQ